MANEKDKRIGTLAPDGSVETWPETNFTGGSYSKPATRHNLDAGRFVVLPMNFTDWDALKELKGVTPVAPQPDEGQQTSDDISTQGIGKRK